MPRRPSARRRLVRRASLLCAVVLVSLPAAELLLRWLTPSAQVYRIWPPFLERRTEPPPDVFPGVAGPSLFRTSSLGLRADELEDGRSPVVLAVGGSTTECLVLDQSEAWPARLQDELSGDGRRAWVGNAGRSGHSTREHVVQVPVLLDELPRVDVLVVLAGANDLGLRLSQDTSYDPGFMQAADVETQEIPRAFSEYPREFAGDLPFYKRTELYARLRLLKNRLASWLGPSADQGPRGDGLTRWRENRRRASAIRERMPDLGPALEEYRRNLTFVVRSAQERGVTVVLLTQPTIWRTDLGEPERERLWWGGVGDFQAPGASVPYYSVDALAEGCDDYNRALLDVARQTGALGFDLAARIPKTAEMFYDDMHFTERGAARVAQALAEFLRGQGVLDR